MSVAGGVRTHLRRLDFAEIQQEHQLVGGRYGAAAQQVGLLARDGAQAPVLVREEGQP